MPCYKPLLGLHDGYNVNGKKHYSIKPNEFVKSYRPGELYEGYEAILIPCGKCIGCRLDYSRQWADRMMLELYTTGKGMFVTLTYDDEHLGNNQLDKRDSQLWMKRLREYFADQRIRFYCAGEYGSVSGRRHLHAILFGIGLEDIKDKRLYKRTKLGFNLYTSDIMSRLWQYKGYVIISDVSWETCAYVARYVTKKLGSMDAYKIEKRAPEFSLMSRKPGIGAEYLIKHPECLDMISIPISTAQGGIDIRIPKYYIKQLEKTDPLKAAEIREKRKKYANDQALLKLSKTDLDFQEYLDMLFEKKKKSANALIRCDI